MATSRVEGYNVSLTIGSKTLLGRTQEDLNISAVTKTSITKDDNGVQQALSLGESLRGVLDIYFAAFGSLSVDYRFKLWIF